VANCTWLTVSHVYDLIHVANCMWLNTNFFVVRVQFTLGCFKLHDLCVSFGCRHVQAMMGKAWFALMQSHSRTPWHDFECLEHKFGLMLHHREDVHSRRALPGVSHCKAMRQWLTARRRMVLVLAPQTTALTAYD
jgi:hypothetical protein